MGNKHNRPEVIHECARLAASKFTEDELILLQKTWQDLADRTNGKGVDKDTFLQYVKLSGLLGERLFAQFDVKKNNCLDMDEFITGLATLCRGTTDDKIRFLFDMYDVSADDTVSKAEFGTLLNQIPRAILDHTMHHRDMSNRVSRAQSMMPVDMSEFDHGGILHSEGDFEDHHSRCSSMGVGSSLISPPPNQVYQSHAVSPNYEEEVDAYTNHDVIEKAFAECDLTGEGRLHYQEFKMWVNRNPVIIDYFQELLPYSGSKHDTPRNRQSVNKKEALPHGRKNSISRGPGGTMSKVQWESGPIQDSINGGPASTPRYGMRQKMSFSGGSPDVTVDTLHRQNSYRLSDLRNGSPAPSIKKGEAADIWTDELPHVADAIAKSEDGTPVERDRVNTLVRTHSQSSDHTIVVPRFRNDKATQNLTATAVTGYAGNAGSNPELTDEIYDLDGTAVDSEVMTYMLLERAMTTTKNEELRRVIREVIDHIPGIANIIDNNNYNHNTSNNSLMHAEARDRFDSESSSVNTTLEGFLWKKGKFLHLWSKRWFILSGNCMYYYDKNNKEDMSLKGVIFLTGCLVVVMEDDVENEVKGYYGFELTQQDLTTGEHHRHEKRVFYCKSVDERLQWVTLLQHAAEVIPIEDDYVIGKELGKGRFSVVKECVHIRTNKHCAVKVIDKRTIEVEDKGLLRTEIAVLKLVDHPNIIKLEGIYESKFYIYIVMEKLSGGELFERIVGRPRFSELEAARLIKPLLEAVAYLHDLGIAHRDLKPENILCSDNIEDIKIADFGLSKMVLPREKMEGACGTLSYVAPEVLSMQGYGVQADIWSVGVILFLILCGKLPFDGDDHNEIIRKTVQCEPLVNPLVWNKLSEGGRGIVMSMLNKNPKNRITARECLKHPWIITHCPHHTTQNALMSHQTSPQNINSKA